MEEHLRCGVCLELFEDPRTLPCQHVLCYKCIKSLPVNTLSHQITCPFCKKSFPSDRVDDLPKNFIIASMVDDMKKIITEKCPQHISEEIKLYCDNCQVPACFMCKLTSDQHKKCEMRDIKKALKEKKENISQATRQVEKVLGNLKLVEKEHEQNIGDFQKFAEKVEWEAAEKIDELVNILLNKKDKILTEINRAAKCDVEDMQDILAPSKAENHEIKELITKSKQTESEPSINQFFGNCSDILKSLESHANKQPCGFLPKMKITCLPEGDFELLKDVINNFGTRPIRRQDVNNKNVTSEEFAKCVQESLDKYK